MHSTAAPILISVRYLILKILPTSTNNLDLIFLPPGNNPYFIEFKRPKFFCCLKKFFKYLFVSLATLDSFFLIIFNYFNFFYFAVCFL